MVVFNSKNLEKIAQLNPTEDLNSSFSTKPIFIFQFSDFPADYQFNLNIALFGLFTNRNYLLDLRAYDNNDELVMKDRIALNKNNLTFDDSKLIIPGIGSSGFNVQLKPITVLENSGRTIRFEADLLNEDATLLDSAHTFANTQLSKQ